MVDFPFQWLLVVHDITDITDITKNSFRPDDPMRWSITNLWAIPSHVILRLYGVGVYTVYCMYTVCTCVYCICSIGELWIWQFDNTRSIHRSILNAYWKIIFHGPNWWTQRARSPEVCGLAEEYRQIVAVLQANPQLLGQEAQARKPCGDCNPDGPRNIDKKTQKIIEDPLKYVKFPF